MDKINLPSLLRWGPFPPNPKEEHADDIQPDPDCLSYRVEQKWPKCDVVLRCLAIAGYQIVTFRRYFSTLTTYEGPHPIDITEALQQQRETRALLAVAAADPEKPLRIRSLFLKVFTCKGLVPFIHGFLSYPDVLKICMITHRALERFDPSETYLASKARTHLGWYAHRAVVYHMAEDKSLLVPRDKRLGKVRALLEAKMKPMDRLQRLLSLAHYQCRYHETDYNAGGTWFMKYVPPHWASILKQHFPMMTDVCMRCAQRHGMINEVVPFLKSQYPQIPYDEFKKLVKASRIEAVDDGTTFISDDLHQLARVFISVTKGDMTTTFIEPDPFSLARIAAVRRKRKALAES